MAADFTIVVRELNPTEIAEVNENLPAAMSSIAPVIGDVKTTYTSKYNKRKIRIFPVITVELFFFLTCAVTLQR